MVGKPHREAVHCKRGGGCSAGTSEGTMRVQTAHHDERQRTLAATIAHNNPTHLRKSITFCLEVPPRRRLSFPIEIQLTNRIKNIIHINDNYRKCHVRPVWATISSQRLLLKYLGQHGGLPSAIEFFLCVYISLIKCIATSPCTGDRSPPKLPPRLLLLLATLFHDSSDCYCSRRCFPRTALPGLGQQDVSKPPRLSDHWN